MTMVNIHDAKTNFSKLVEEVRHGKEVTIAKAGIPMVKVVPIPASKQYIIGVMRNKIKISDDFDAPLPHDVLASFEE